MLYYTIYMYANIVVGSARHSRIHTKCYCFCPHYVCAASCHPGWFLHQQRYLRHSRWPAAVDSARWWWMHRLWLC